MKRFPEWMRIKQRLDDASKEPPLVSERDMWWISFGENIGAEIYGKGELFTRPGIVIRKFSNGFYLVAPTTSQRHEGVWFTPIILNGVSMVVCLHHIRAVDYRRFSTKIGQMNEAEFQKVKNAFNKLYR